MSVDLWNKFPCMYYPNTPCPVQERFYGFAKKLSGYVVKEDSEANRTITEILIATVINNLPSFCAACPQLNADVTLR